MKSRFIPLQFAGYPEEEMLARSRRFHEEMDRRRTVRDFSDRPLPLEVLRRAVLTAGTAPSGAHKQPWRFVLVGDPAVKKEIRRAAEREEQENYSGRMPPAWIEDLEPLGTDWRKPFLTTCPRLIVVFAESYGMQSDGEKRKNYYVQESVGIAVGMLLSALHYAGVATLTHTPSPMAFLQKILGRPANERAYMLIACGYPAEDCQVPDLKRKSLEEILTEL